MEDHSVTTDEHDRRTALYRATCLNHPDERWRPSIHMPRWACRLTLEVVSVRVERLQDITEEDAKAEGMAVPVGQDFVAARGLFAALWDKINGDRWPKRMASWEANPWVWRLVFKRVEVQHG